jgi:hypothetical protein
MSIIRVSTHSGVQRNVLSHPLRKQNTATHRASSNQTVIRLAAAAALTLHAAKWNSYRARPTNGLSMNISATVYEAARCESSTRQQLYFVLSGVIYSLPQYFKTVDLFYHISQSFQHTNPTLHKSVPLSKAPLIPRWFTHLPTYLPRYQPTIYTLIHSLPYDFVPPGSSIRIVYAFSSLLMHATCSPYIKVLHLIVLKIFPLQA